MDIKVKVEELEVNLEHEQTSQQGFITYVRRKRRRPVLDALQPQALGSTPRKDKLRDIGWKHGMVIDGNPSHWMCNWCGLIRYGGGVSRLKKHLAGVFHVKKCPNVPEEVAKCILNHLVEKQKAKKKKLHSCSTVVGMNCSSPDDLYSEDHKRSDLETHLGSSMEFARGTIKKCKPTVTDIHSSEATAQYFNNFVDKPTLKDGHADARISVTNGEDCNAKLISHWSNVLENMPQLIRMSEDGGMQNYIAHALAYDPYGVTRKFKFSDLAKDAQVKEYHDKFSDDSNIKDQHQDTSENVAHSSKSGSSCQKETNTNIPICQKFFLDVICSDKFALLCDLISENFQESKAKSLLDFSAINIKMKNGEYEQSPASFYQDMQQVWSKFKILGQEMVFLANSLSSMSQIFSQMKVGKDLVTETNGHKPEANGCTDVAKNSVESHTSTLLTFSESNHSTKPDQTEASGLCRTCICKQCGTEANRERSVICGGCGAVYHFSCSKLDNKDSQTQRWYCVSCTTSNKDSSEPILENIKLDSLHQHCIVCDRLEISVTQNDHHLTKEKSVIATDSRDSSVSSMETNEHAALSLTAKSSLCKICGQCEDEDKKFLVCGHDQCPYKFYHIRCLKSSQIASSQQQNKPCWYCPSCLCRACLCNRDDDEIILCDDCDEAYHIYCMKPPRSSVPKGQWYCISCNVARARDGMKRYERWILQQHSRNYSNEASSSMDLLISAAEKIKSEELIAGH